MVFFWAMNELIFFFHVLLVFVFVLGALKLGRGALVAWVAMQAVLANLFVTKQIELFGCTVTCSDVFAIGSILGLNLLQEYFGLEEAKKGVRICFYFMIFFALMSCFHLLYLPSVQDASHASFLKILAPAPRLLIASLVTFLLVQQLDVRLYAFLKKKLASVSLRNGVSLSITQLVDTLLFSFLGLFGLVSSLGEIIFMSYLIKLAITFCLSSCLAFTKRVVHEV